MEADVTTDRAMVVESEVFAEPTTVAGLAAHLQAGDHNMQGNATDGMSLSELQQMHLGLHRKEAPDHLHPELDTDEAVGEKYPTPMGSKSSSTDDLYRAIYPGVAVREVNRGRPVLFGHFTKFNEWTEIDSRDEGHFLEQVAPGSFADSFNRLTPKVLLNHGKDPTIGDQILGIPETLREDSQGPYYEVPMFEGVPPLVMSGLRAGAYGASFRFHVEDQVADRKPGRSDHNPEGLPERTITKASVAEFGPVTFPAYTGATAGIRSMTDRFRPRSFDEEVAQMAREHPDNLAKVIHRALKSSPATEEKPLEEKPPATPRFRTREEWLEWM
jgi:phage head maturation protease